MFVSVVFMSVLRCLFSFVLLTRKDILPRGFVSYVSSSKGNCLFNSASAVLYGNEDHTNRLRLATLLDGINKSDFYVKQVST